MGRNTYKSIPYYNLNCLYADKQEEEFKIHMKFVMMYSLRIHKL